jgi:hypothetical protein
MNNNLLQIKIKQRLNKLSSLDYDNLECWQIAEAFNKAQIEWVRRQLHGTNAYKEGDESSIRRIDDLQKLLTTVNITGSMAGDVYFEVNELPENYLEFKRVSIKGKTEDCPDRSFVVYLAEESDIDLLLSDKITNSIYTSKYNEIITQKKITLSKTTDLKDELESKEKYKKKQSNSNYQIKSIKDNKRILKRTIDEVIDKLIIYPIKEHNLINYFQYNKQDKFVFVEIYTFLNEKTPLLFVVSQRSEYIITPKSDEFDKTKGILNIGGFNIDEEEEEEGSISMRKLFHLTSLD